MDEPRLHRRLEGTDGSGRGSGADGFGHGVVDFKDDALGAVIAIPLGFILALHDGEGVHDVGHGGAGRGEAGLASGFRGVSLDANRRCLGWQVEVEEGGVQLAAEQEAAILVPTERRPGPAAILCERL